MGHAGPVCVACFSHKIIKFKKKLFPFFFPSFHFFSLTHRRTPRGSLASFLVSFFFSPFSFPLSLVSPFFLFFLRPGRPTAPPLQPCRPLGRHVVPLSRLSLRALQPRLCLSGRHLSCAPACTPLSPPPHAPVVPCRLRVHPPLHAQAASSFPHHAGLVCPQLLAVAVLLRCYPSHAVPSTTKYCSYHAGLVYHAGVRIQA